MRYDLDAAIADYAPCERTVCEGPRRWILYLAQKASRRGVAYHASPAHGWIVIAARWWGALGSIQGTVRHLGVPCDEFGTPVDEGDRPW